MTADADSDASMGSRPARRQLLKQHPAVCPENSDTDRCRPFAGIASSSHMRLAFHRAVEDSETVVVQEAWTMCEGLPSMPRAS